MIQKKEIIKKIKTHLWQWNHKVRDVSGLMEYDLLVDGKIRVRVFSCENKPDKECTRIKDCDVAVFMTDAGKKYYSLGEQYGESDPDFFKNFKEYFNTLKNAMTKKIKVEPLKNKHKKTQLWEK